MFHIHRMVSRAVVLALLGFLYTPSTANAELQQGNPANSSPPIYKQKHLQEIGQVAQARANRRVASRVRLLKRLDARCKRGNKRSCNQFNRVAKRYPAALQKFRSAQVSKPPRQNIPTGAPGISTMTRMATARPTTPPPPATSPAAMSTMTTTAMMPMAR